MRSRGPAQAELGRDTLKHRGVDKGRLPSTPEPFEPLPFGGVSVYVVEKREMMASSDDDHIGVDFIDPLFAVALGLNFEALQKESWFTDWLSIVHSPQNCFIFLTLVLAWATVILSWVGYHRSIKTNPIKVQTFAGWCRFILDVLLLVFYSILLVSYADFKVELRVLAVVFSLFIVWDIFKKREHPIEDYEKKYKDDYEVKWKTAGQQRGVTVVWFVFFLLLMIFYAPHPPQSCPSCEDWLFLALACLGTVFYRVHKKKLWPRRILEILGY